MGNAETSNGLSLDDFIGKFEDNHYCLELLQFFGAHPCARFNKLALIHALSDNGGKSHVERALAHLAKKGIVEAYTDNNAHLYSLTEREPMHEMVVDLAKLGGHKWQVVLRQSAPWTTEISHPPMLHAVAAKNTS
ncbi:MAG: hypothetical protein HY530_03930 [Chloroflexi bacterium]|nr:hypothetical protein [Chloroflexota bacterium]